MLDATPLAIRWTIGDVSDRGWEELRLSVWGARRLFGPGTEAGVVVATTIANQNSAEVRAFNQKVGAATVKPEPAAGGQPYLAAPALAYITQHYPDARLLAVKEVKPANDGPAQYQAELAIGRRPVNLLFDAQGQFIAEVPYTR